MKKLSGTRLLKRSFTKRLTPYFVFLILGWSEVVVAPPATAQHSSRDLPLQTAQTSSIAGNWRLVNMTAGTSTPMVPSQDTALTADFADGRITGSGGCNRFMGGYELDGDRLSIDPLASTFMACEEPVMSQETRYLTALQGAQRYEVNDQGELQIFYQTEQESGVLRFVSQTARALW